MPVKRAHMVTRGYLAAWANDRNQVFVADAEAGRAGVRSLGDATVVGYAYRTEITNVDLESEYAAVESNAVPAIRNLASGGSITSGGRDAIVHFLDMHLERGRWADQSAVRIPVGIATIDQPGGDFRMAQAGLGDRLALSRIEGLGPNDLKIANLGIDRWPWRVAAVESGLVTGDGAVLAVSQRDGDAVTTVSFPLSPTRLLIIGEGFGRTAVPINGVIAGRCRRWLVDRVDGEAARVSVA